MTIHRAFTSLLALCAAACGSGGGGYYVTDGGLDGTSSTASR
jgi:hypothetical protein